MIDRFSPSYFFKEIGYLIVAPTGYEHAYRLAERFPSRITVGLLGSIVPAYDRAFEVLSDNCVLRRLNDGREDIPVLPYFLFFSDYGNGFPFGS